MYALIAPLFRLVSTLRAPRRQPGIARVLLESAEARAGLDPQQSHELRQAAYAYLRVVR